MAIEEKSPSTALNIVKWVLVLLLIAASIVGNIYFSHYALAERAIALIIIAVVVLLLLKATTQGARAWVFIKDARTEMRKVVWPTRQETLRTTGLVIAVVAILSLILWGVDSVFALLVSSIIS